MGVVYRAERADGRFEQEVALKLLRRGLDTEDAARRFRTEQHILASLQHPNIARLLDGGVTDEGVPYLVMEYIEGQSITDYCDVHCLSIGQRLGLFEQVCRAVQHAHRNLIIHRDLKPSNILVAESDGDAQIKLLDFGIAKLLDEDGAFTAVVTRSGSRMMTPEYASPEQIKGEAVTTATDVYQLGVLLYELLTGHRPYPTKRRRLNAVVEAILDEEPTPPSTVVTLRTPTGTVEITPQRVSRARGTSVDRLRRLLAGDLDVICLKAIRKEPERRYESAAALADDLRRHQAGLPVTARADTAGYRMRKFVRRHRWGAAVTAVIVLLLAGYAMTVTLQAERIKLALADARLEAEKAEEVTTFLMELFEASDPNEALGDTLTVHDVLARGVERADAWGEQPAVKAQMLDVVGRVYKNLGRYDDAQPLLERALAIRRSLYGGDHPEVASSLDNIAQLLRRKGDYEAAGALVREALAMRRALQGDNHPDVAESVNSLAQVLHDRGDFEAAEPLYRQALRMRRAAFGAEHLDVVETMGELAALLDDSGDYPAAESLYRDALALKRRLLGAEHPEVASSMNNLGHLMHRKGDYASAERFYRESLAMDRKLLGSHHPTTATVLNNLGILLWDRGDYAAAEPILREALSIKRELLGDAHPSVATSVSNLGYLLRDKGDLAAAEPLLHEALSMRLELLGPEHPHIAQSLSNLAFLHRDKGDYDAAEALYREALEMFRNQLGPEHPSVGAGLNNLAELLFHKGEYGASESMHREALEMYYNVLGREHPRIAVALDDLAVVLHQQGDAEQADSLGWLSLTMREGLLGPEHPDVATSLHHLAQIRLGIGDEQGADEHYQRALEIYRQRFGAGDRRVRAIYEELIDVYEARGMPDRAAPYRRLMAD